MNTRIKTAFALSISALAGASTYFLILIIKRFDDLFISRSSYLWVLIYLFTVISPIILSIVSLNMIKRVKAEGQDRTYKTLTRIFSLATLGTFALYITILLFSLLFIGTWLLSF